MTLKDMQYFYTIVQEKNITKAASTLYIAQPALSQCVQKLEKELNATLLTRTSIGVSVTAEGKCFFEFVERILLEQKNFQKELIDVQNAEGGEITLGFTGTQATYVLPYFLPAFESRHPNIRILLEEATSNDIEQRLSKGTIDIGIIHPPVLNPDLDYFELSRDHMVVVPRRTSGYEAYVRTHKNQAHPYIDIEFLRNEPIAVTQPWQRSRMITEQIFTNAGFAPRYRQVSRNISTMDALAQIDYATVLIPEKQLSPALQKKGYFLLEEPYDVPFSFYVAVKRDGYTSKATLRLLDFLRGICHTF